MAAVGEIEKPDCAIFADVGWEPPNVYQHLQWLIGCELTTTPDGRTVAVPGVYQGGQLNFPTWIVQQGDLRADLQASADNGSRISQPPCFLRHPDGTKGQIRRACTFQYKVRPLERKIREMLGMKARQKYNGKVCEKWYGISLDEVQRMRESDVPFIANRYPLIEKEKTRQGCLIWMEQHGYPAPPKSACVGCPFHSDHYWRNMRDTDPESWADAVVVDKLIRHGIRGVNLPAYLHASLVPLDQVDLRTRREKGQYTFWDDDMGGECGGECGL